MKKHITKYQYIEYLKCPRSFAYALHATPNEESGQNPIKVFLTTQGREVGLLAQDLYKGQFGINFEKEISHDDLFARFDIFDCQNNELIEMKSTTEVKKDQLIDAAFQKYICDKSGVKVDKVKIGHINKNYVLKDELNLKDLFIFEDVTSAVTPFFAEIEKDLPVIRKIIIDGTLPEKKIGQHCMSGDGCPYRAECLGGAVNDTIFNLRRDIKGKKFELHQSGVRFLKDIPEYVSLTKFQTIQKKAEALDCAVINYSDIINALQEVVYPTFFLDFEASVQAVPKYHMSSPFQQIPFQASVHRLKGSGLKLKHYSFLNTEDIDPRPALAKFLIETLEEYGSIVAYHASYEKSRIYELIKSAPQYEKELLALIDRIWDLEEIFSKGMYVHPNFMGSTSIKKILPIFCPELSYDNLEINNGQLAFIQYLKMISSDTPKDQKEKIKNNLEAYCFQDTYAMYAIFKKISELI